MRVPYLWLAAALLCSSIASEVAGSPRAVPIPDPPGPQPGQQHQVEAISPRPRDSASSPGASSPNESRDIVNIAADSEIKNGSLFTYEGYVNATMGEVRLQADHVVFDSATGDLIAEGNVVYDEGADQRITARRAELNTTTHRGTFWETTGFTDRTATGEYLFFSAERVVKVGPQTYDLFNATVTACEDTVPKWSFTSKRAELRVDDRIKLYDALFRVKGFPFLPFPYAWLPTTKRERKSGLLIPSTGNSNQKGRMIRGAYFQELGNSADVTIRGDLYTSRGFGFGAQFRAQTDDDSHVVLGIFSVKDGLFGYQGPNQGGTAVLGNAIQHLPDGWLAVANVSLVTSLPFRQVFSDDISQVINPTQESTFFANKNSGGLSANFLADDEINTIFRPGVVPGTGDNEDIKIRRLPEADITGFSREPIKSLPVYFSFDSSLGALQRIDVNDTTSSNVLVTSGFVPRLDFEPRVTAHLPAFGGFAITPSVAIRGTFYGDSLSSVPLDFASGDPLAALDGSTGGSTTGRPRQSGPPSLGGSFFRRYAELDVDFRPPALARDFTNDDGAARFRHLIETYVTYRVIKGIGGDFDRIIKFDANDAVANTDEIEYAFVNRFFITRSVSEITRRRKRKPASYRPMEPERPLVPSANPSKGASGAGPVSGAPSDSAPSSPPAPPGPPETPGQDGQSGSAPAPTPAGQAERRQGRLETGQSSELNDSTLPVKQQNDRSVPKGPRKPGQTDKTRPGEEPEGAFGDQAIAEAYEFLTVKVAQKYFFDRFFGGALAPGLRNQFFPLDTLTGFTYAGVARSFSPVNVSVRYRPLSYLYTDLRMDVGQNEGVRDMTVSAGASKGDFGITGAWFLSRAIKAGLNAFEPGTFDGSQLFAGLSFGNPLRGPYAGSQLGYDFTNQFLTATEVSKGRLTNTRSYFGYSWNCCGLQFNYTTFKAGLRNENSFSVTITLAGIGTYGTDQFSQLGAGTPKGKRNRALPDDFGQ